MSVATAENRIDLPRAAKLNKKIITDRRKPATKKTAWAGRIISAVPVLFLVFDGAMKLMNAAPVVEAQNQLGIPQSLTLSIGILELACVLVYAISGSSILGAILLTRISGRRHRHPVCASVIRFSRTCCFWLTWAPFSEEASTFATSGCNRF